MTSISFYDTFFPHTGLVPSGDQLMIKLGENGLLSCCLYPESSALAMEIRWFKGTDCIYMYKSGQVRVKNDYKGRVTLCLEELVNGRINLTLIQMKEQDAGNYMCEVLCQGEPMMCGLRVNFSPYSKSPF